MTSTESTALAAVYQDALNLLARAGGPLRRLRVQAGDTLVELEWPDAGTPLAVAATGNGTLVDAAPAVPDGRFEIRSPMVGTFYHAPQPGSPVFARVGDVVEAGQPVGIVEAMKLMNLIETDRRGRVVDIPVPDGTAVEFDQCLVVLALELDDASTEQAGK
jgi:acetyl-CoA carboxylase biotin carboxyl carrier protein